MSTLETLFASSQPVTGRLEKIESIKGWMRTHLSVDTETAIMVKQVECRDPACPGIETVVALLEPRRIQKFKLRMPISIRKGNFTVKEYPQPN
jgi:hypothetical protein